MNLNILIRTDGSGQLGNGHIIRMLALTDELSLRGFHFMFALKYDDYWIKKIREKNINVIVLSKGTNHLVEFIDILEENRITHLVYDTRDDLTKDELIHLKENAKLKLIVIDSPEDVRLAADLNLYPPIPQIEIWNWEGYFGKTLSGWEYVMLRNGIFNANNKKSIKKDRSILLSFGATDPFGLTEKTLLAIDKCNSWKYKYKYKVICGPQFERIDKIEKLAQKINLPIEVYQSPDKIDEIFLSVDFAITAFGVTAYELASLSIPSFYIAISPDHLLSATNFEKLKIGKVLGTIDDFDMQLEESIEILITNNYFFDIKKNNCFPAISNWSKIINEILIL